MRTNKHLMRDLKITINPLSKKKIWSDEIIGEEAL
mgnify:FL=1